jgi:SAM-dependent methyltransferase
MNESYVIAGGAAGRDRLRLLSEVMEPHTRDLIERAGVRPGARCLDVGCGGGEVSYLLAATVGDSGQVVSVDLDEAQLEIVRKEAQQQGMRNVTFECRDVTSWEPETAFDFIYMRFILTHLPDPAGFLMSVCRHLRPGGMALAEDIDFRGHLSEPDCPALSRSVDLYTASVRKRGADPNIGPRLPGLLRGAGLTDVGINLFHPARMEPGGIKELVALTAQRTAETAVGDGLATKEEMQKTVAELFEFARNPETLIAGPRIFQAWGSAPS